MQTLNFDFEHSVNNDFRGINAVYHGYAGLPDEDGRVYSDDICEMEADIAKRIGLRIARTYYKWYAWENGQWDWENETITAFYRWLERMKKRSIDVALNMCFCFPGSIYSQSPSWESDSPFTVLDNWEESLSNYCAWVSETLHQLVEKRGFVNIKYLFLFTEPVDKKTHKLPEGKAYNECYIQTVRAIHDRLVKDGRRHLVGLIGANESYAYFKNTPLLKLCAEKASDCLDYYSAHEYQHFRLNSPKDVHTGKRCVFFSKPGYRIQQNVTLKAGTEYTVSVWLKMKNANRMTISGNVLFGLFDAAENSLTKGLISAGGQPTTRLQLDSVRMIDAVFLDDCWQEFSHSFIAAKNGDAIFGVFNDIKSKGAELLADDVSLKESNKNQEMLKNTGFEDESGWKTVISYPLSYNSFDEWTGYCTKFLKSLSAEQPFWFDEYNVLYRFDERFTNPYWGTWLAEANTAMMSAGVQSSFLWTLFDQQWPNNHTNTATFEDGNHRCGVIPLLNNEAKPYPAYYAFALLSRFMCGGEGTVVYKNSSEDKHRAVASIWPDGNISILVVNITSENEDISFELPVEILKTNKTIYKYLYDPKNIADIGFELIPASEEYSSCSEIKDSIPPVSFTVYTTTVI